LPFVALDTEFMRVDTFYPIAGLLQVGDGVRAYLIDPLTIDNWQPLAALLENPAVVKVVHACSEDLEVLLRLTGSLPAPLFDTQLAAAYLNLGFSMGYSRLVQEVLGIDLPKGETRSDWLQRPLSETQISYAAEDAVHLAEVFVSCGRNCPTTNTPGCWRTAPNWWPTCAVKSTRTRSIATPSWPGNCPAPNLPCCASCAPGVRKKPAPVTCRATVSSVSTRCGHWPGRSRTTSRVGKIEDMHPRTVRQDGEFLLDLIKRSGSVSPDQWPPAVPEPLPVDAAALIKQLRAIGQAEAERLNIAPELMLRKKTLEALLKSGFPDGPYQLPDSLRGWRRELMGQALLDSLATAGEQP
jgi:ribonuclease D